MKNLNFLPPLIFLGQSPLPQNSKIGVGEASRVGRRNELMWIWMDKQVQRFATDSVDSIVKGLKPKTQVNCKSLKFISFF